ncbi:MAG: hypothetical protein K0R10_59 [Alphaproteobacteria bacterium]|jgi:hypothetical protein|nr:hypothetical protein [Alphaproteobacteria bacterium]
MEKPKKPAEWIFAVILSFLALLLAGRGVVAIVTGHYTGSTRYSGAYTLEGAAAVLHGTGYVFLGLIVLTALAMQLKLPRRTCVILGAIGLAGAILTFVGSFFYPM